MIDFFNTVLNELGLSELWRTHYDVSIIKAVLLGGLMLGIDFGFFFLNWFLNCFSITEVGFPRRKRKYVKKITRSYGLLSRITLIPLYIDADNRSFYILIRLITNFLNILAALLSVVGYIGCIVTHTDGWCATILLTAGLGSLGLFALINFIPDLIWLPSERRRYGLGRRKRK